MSKCFFQVFLLFSFVSIASAQTVNRYPYVQSPDDTSVIIAWRTVTAGNSYLMYGNSPTTLLDTIKVIGAIKKHNIKIGGLLPNTRYYYQVATSAGYTSNVESFYTAKLNNQKSLKFLHYGDCGFNNSIQTQIAGLMKNQTVDFAIVTGDVDQNQGDDYDNRYFSIYKDMLKEECHFTAIGNHDTYADNAATYLDEFYLPHNNPANSERYYSFTWGNAKFICLDSNLPYTAGTAQYNWLLDELKCNEKQWVFVYCHHPAWTNYWSLDYILPGSPYFLYDGNDDMRTSIVPLFEQYGVDFVLNGHTHLYQKAEQNGVKYILSGGSGQDPTTNTEAQRVTHPQVTMVKKINQYVLWDINGDTTSFYCIDKNAVVQDQESKVKTFVDYSVNLSAQNVSCKGLSDGSATIAITGSKGPYKVLWNTGDSTFSIQNKPAGLYSVYVKNIYGCEKYYEIKIEEPALLSINKTVTNPYCFGVANGNIKISATAGTAPYSYIWSTNSTTDSIYDLSATKYTVTATDAHNCMAVDSSILSYQYSYQPSIIAAQNFVCNGDSLVLSTNNYLNYLWSNNATSAAITINAGGTFALQTVDSAGCIGNSNSLTIQQDSIASATFNVSANNLQIYFLVNKQSDYYTYIFGDGVVKDTTVRGLYHTYTTDGYYTVKIISHNRCGSDTSTQTIKVGNPAAIEDLEAYAVNLYPIPMTTQSNFSFNNFNKKYAIAILDLQGKIIQQYNQNKNNSFVFERQQMSAGIYFIKVYGEINFAVKLLVTD